MGLLGTSFDEKVRGAIAQIDGMGLGVKGLAAAVSGKVVTLTGEAPSLEVKTRVMAEFNSRVEADNVVNRITITAGAAPKDAAAKAAPAPAADFEWYEVQKGDTLSALAKRFYGGRDRERRSGGAAPRLAPPGRPVRRVGAGCFHHGRVLRYGAPVRTLETGCDPGVLWRSGRGGGNACPDDLQNPLRGLPARRRCARIPPL